MQPLRIARLFCLATSALALAGSVSAARAEVEEKPTQITTRIETAVIHRDTFHAADDERIQEFRRKRVATGGAAAQLRAFLAASIAEGHATVIDSMEINTIQGVPFQTKTGRDAKRPELTAKVRPTLADGQVKAELELTYRSNPEAKPQTVRETVTVDENAYVAVGFRDAEGGPLERLYFLKFSRLKE